MGKRNKGSEDHRLTAAVLAGYYDRLGWSDRSIHARPDGGLAVESGWTSSRHDRGFALRLDASDTQLGLEVRAVVMAPLFRTPEPCLRELLAQLIHDNYRLSGLAWAWDVRDGEVVLKAGQALDGCLPYGIFESLHRGVVALVERSYPRLRAILDVDGSRATATRV